MKYVLVFMLAAMSVFAAACGGDAPCHNDDCSHCHDVECGNPPDAPAVPDAPTPAVATVACGGTIALVIGTVDGAYGPQGGTIASGGIVKFELGNGLEVQSGTAASPTDAFAFAPNVTGCVQFNHAGTYAFFSSTHAVASLRHDITGSITVE